MASPSPQPDTNYEKLIARMVDLVSDRDASLSQTQWFILGLLAVALVAYGFTRFRRSECFARSPMASFGLSFLESRSPLRPIQAPTSVEVPEPSGFAPRAGNSPRPESPPKEKALEKQAPSPVAEASKQTPAPPPPAGSSPPSSSERPRRSGKRKSLEAIAEQSSNA